MFWRKKKQKQPPNGDNQVVFIEKAGACICTWSVLRGETPLKWCVRGESVHPADTGWVFLGASDTEEYINIVSNSAVVDFNTVANIEPAVLALYNMPVGTDLRLEKYADNSLHFFDTDTGEEVEAFV